MPGSSEWKADGADDFWSGPTVAQQIAARREADREVFASGWSRIYYGIAIALVVCTLAMLTLR